MFPFGHFKIILIQYCQFNFTILHINLAFIGKVAENLKKYLGDDHFIY